MIIEELGWFRVDDILAFSGGEGGSEGLNHSFNLIYNFSFWVIALSATIYAIHAVSNVLLA